MYGENTGNVKLHGVLSDGCGYVVDASDRDVVGCRIRDGLYVQAIRRVSVECVVRERYTVRQVTRAIGS